MATQTVCGGCGAYLPTGATFCERCGWAHAAPRDSGMLDRLIDNGSWHGLWKWLWTFWTIAYPLLIIGDAISAGTDAAAQFASLFVAGTLFAPWIIGVITFGVLFTVTRPDG